jgi:hypothetical protein
MMATSDNFSPRSRPEEFPPRKFVGGIDDDARLATQSLT